MQSYKIPLYMDAIKITCPCTKYSRGLKSFKFPYLLCHLPCCCFLSPLVSVTNLRFFSSSNLQLLQVAVRFRTESEVLIKVTGLRGSTRQPRAMQMFETNVVFEAHAKKALVAQTVKNLSTMRETGSSIPGSGRSPVEENGYPPQYSCLKNSMDRGAWQAIVHRVAKSWT